MLRGGVNVSCLLQAAAREMLMFFFPVMLNFETFLPFRASEGKTVEIEYRGDINNTIQDILGGVRSTCTYVGAQKLKELSRRTTFIRVTQQLNQIFK